jgi:aryl-alcohol dehydrogenase-like predicted oxidoreductase
MGLPSGAGRSLRGRVMERRSLGRLFDVSVLTLGGGGIAGEWGATDRGEAVGTVRRAYDQGITLFDVAPSYGNGRAEAVVGDAFGGRYPDDARIVTKCAVGMVAPGTVDAVLENSLSGSLARLRRDHVDVILLHGAIVPDGSTPPGQHSMRKVDITVSFLENHVRPALMRVVERGQAGAWGITAAGPLQAMLRVLADEPAPAVAQCVANLLDSPGDMHIDSAPPNPRAIISVAASRQIGVMGIRAVQAGALTDALDHDVAADDPEAIDYRRAAAFRDLAAAWEVSPGHLAHRYALSMPGVDTVVLGVKNRRELSDCVAAAEAGRLTPAELLAIEKTVLEVRDRTREEPK